MTATHAHLLGAVVIYRGAKWRVSDVLSRGRVELAPLSYGATDLRIALADAVAVVEGYDDELPDGEPAAEENDDRADFAREYAADAAAEVE